MNRFPPKSVENRERVHNIGVANARVSKSIYSTSTYIKPQSTINIESLSTAIDQYIWNFKSKQLRSMQCVINSNPSIN